MRASGIFLKIFIGSFHKSTHYEDRSIWHLKPQKFPSNVLVIYYFSEQFSVFSGQ